MKSFYSYFSFTRRVHKIYYFLLFSTSSFSLYLLMFSSDSRSPSILNQRMQRPKKRIRRINAPCHPLLSIDYSSCQREKLSSCNSLITTYLNNSMNKNRILQLDTHLTSFILIYAMLFLN